MLCMFSLDAPEKWRTFEQEKKKVFYFLYLLLCNFIRKSSILSLSFMFSLLSLSTLDSDACSWCSVWRSLSVSASWSKVFVCSSLFSSATVFLSDKWKKNQRCLHVNLSCYDEDWTLLQEKTTSPFFPRSGEARRTREHAWKSRRAQWKEKPKKGSRTSHPVWIMPFFHSLTKLPLDFSDSK